MLVSELIEKLQQLNGDAEVFVTTHQDTWEGFRELEILIDLENCSIFL